MNKKNYIKPSLVVVKMYSEKGYMDVLNVSIETDGIIHAKDRFDSYDENDADWE